MKAPQKKKADTLQPAIPSVNPPLAGTHGEQVRLDDTPDAEIQATHVAMLHNAYLTHPTNAGALAELLNQLQQRYGNSYVQQLLAEANQTPSTAGQPLDSATRAMMETAFGEDLGDVRIHTDEQAQAASASLHARAFTQGQDIYFDQGEYNPASRTSHEMLAHELAHVIQQRRSTPGITDQPAGQAGDIFEQEADQAAAAVFSNEPVQIATRSETPAIQRQQKEKPKEEAPKISYHGKVISVTPPSGTIDAEAKFSVAYSFNVSPNADYIPLTIAIPDGVMFATTPVTHVPEGGYSINDPGGSSARAVTITVSYHLRNAPTFQVTLTKGTFTYIVMFQFPTTAPAKPAAGEKTEESK